MKVATRSGNFREMTRNRGFQGSNYAYTVLVAITAHVPFVAVALLQYRVSTITFRKFFMVSAKMNGSTTDWRLNKTMLVFSKVG